MALSVWAERSRRRRVMRHPRDRSALPRQIDHETRDARGAGRLVPPKLGGMSGPSRAGLVCRPVGPGGGEDFAGGVGEGIGGGVFVAGDGEGDLLQGP